MERDEPAASFGIPDGGAAGSILGGHRPGSGETLNMGEPVTPRPSASVVLLRDRSGPADGFEVLLLRRNPGSRFMPDAWVFPGGAVDAACDGGDGPDALRACAVRELDEEAGIGSVTVGELVPFARWITPEAVAMRFDAMFYLAIAPAGAEAVVDGSEAVEARWLSPRAALDAAERSEIVLTFPTANQVSELAGFGSAAEVLEAYRGHEVTPILPKPVATGEGFRISIPGDLDYPS